MFIESLCHTKGTWARKNFEQIDWQEQIIRDLFGILKPNGYRQFNTAYIRKVDLTFYSVIYGADLTEDWTDPKVWRKANPSLDITVGIDKVRIRLAVIQE